MTADPNANVPVPELLAPAGNHEALCAVLEAGADSVYVAGKLFGMRQHARWLNFTHRGLEKAVRLAHQRGKKIYVTVNNLFTDRELRLIHDYLDFLEALKPDAVIVQDFGLLGICRERKFSIPLHASTMLNVHDETTARFLGRFGVTRIVASRDIPLARAVEIQRKTHIEFEVFLHGDMCIAHSGQCLTSGILEGESSNRGKCLKPCRWRYSLVNLKAPDVPLPTPHPGDYLLARKDLSLLENIPEVAGSGIAALKIEGRARKPEFLRFIVSRYRETLDRYSQAPDDFSFSEDERRRWYENRIRNQSTCYTFGNPQAETIDYSGEREPRFFSIAIEQERLSENWEFNPVGKGHASSEIDPPILVAHCSDAASVQVAVREGADCIRFPALPPTDPTPILNAARTVSASREFPVELGISLDRVLTPAEQEQVPQLFRRYREKGISHVTIHSPAWAESAVQAGLEVIGDFGLNVFNREAIRFLLQQGVLRVTTSLEATLEQVQDFSSSYPGRMECVVHGTLPGMLSEHCVIHAALGGSRSKGTCRSVCKADTFGLRDLLGQIHPIRTDRHCRNEILLPRDLCAFPVLDRLIRAGAGAFRIEATGMPSETLATVLRVYRRGIELAYEENGSVWEWKSLLEDLLRASRRELSLCAYGNRLRKVAAPDARLPTNLVVLRSTPESAEKVS